MQNRILLVLDLDETLIHGTENKLDHDPDFVCCDYYIYLRPFLAEFICEISKDFNVGVWSSAGKKYVESVVKKIFPPSLSLAIIWDRTKCTYRLNEGNLEYQYIKDLKKLKRKGYSISKILIVDNDRHKVVRNYGNAIYVKDFNGDRTDRELLYLKDYLTSLRNADDVRRIEKRQWRSKVM